MHPPTLRAGNSSEHWVFDGPDMSEQGGSRAKGADALKQSPRKETFRVTFSCQIVRRQSQPNQTRMFGIRAVSVGSARGRAG